MLSDSPVPSAGLSRARPVLWGSERGSVQADRRQRGERRTVGWCSGVTYTLLNYIFSNMTVVKLFSRHCCLANNELLFPFGGAQHVKMLHHCFCYIASQLTYSTYCGNTLKMPSLCLKWKIIYCNESSRSDNSLKWNWQKNKICTSIQDLGSVGFFYLFFVRY